MSGGVPAVVLAALAAVGVVADIVVVAVVPVFVGSAFVDGIVLGAAAEFET